MGGGENEGVESGTAGGAAGRFGCATQDHAHCMSAALEAAARVCARRGARLTRLRREVLAILWRDHAPHGAYAILEALRREGRRAAPPTVYRALDFLLAHGLVHRIESQNAYVGCPDPLRPHDGQFLICTECGNAAELSDERIRAAIRAGAGALGFRVTGETVEIAGLCARCQGEDASARGPAQP